MRTPGLEPGRGNHTPLKRTRLPVPPCPLTALLLYDLSNLLSRNFEHNFVDVNNFFAIININMDSLDNARGNTFGFAREKSIGKESNCQLDCNLSAVYLAELLCASRNKQEISQLVQFLQVLISAIRSYQIK